jgi:hypothetical protein
MSFIASRSFARATTRNLVAKAGPRAPLQSSRLLQHQAKSATSLLPSTSRLTSARCFSTTPAAMVHAEKGDAFAAPAPAAQYDQEIVDMASYIHNYKIDSDLAVSCNCIFETRPRTTLTFTFRSTLLVSSSLTLSAAVLRPSSSLTAQSSSVPSSRAPQSPMAQKFSALPTSLTPSVVPSTLVP